MGILDIRIGDRREASGYGIRLDVGMNKYIAIRKLNYRNPVRLGEQLFWHTGFRFKNIPYGFDPWSKTSEIMPWKSKMPSTIQPWTSLLVGRVNGAGTVELHSVYLHG